MIKNASVDRHSVETISTWLVHQVTDGNFHIGFYFQNANKPLKFINIHFK